MRLYKHGVSSFLNSPLSPPMEVHSRRLLLRPDYTSDTPPPPQPLPTSTAGLSSSYSPPVLSNLAVDSKTDSSTVATVVVVLAVLFLFALFSIHVRRLGNRSRSVQRQSRQAGSSRPPPPPPPPPLPRSVDLYVLKSLPVFPFSGTAKYQNHCAICLGEYEENECVKLIPFCQHVYHPECIDRWLYSHASCPVCRSTRFFKSECDEKDGKGSGLGMAEERTSQVGVSRADNLHTCALEVRSVLNV